MIVDPTNLDNQSFAEELALRLGVLSRKFPRDMFLLSDQNLPTGTDRGLLPIWRVFSLLCLESGSECFLIIPWIGISKINNVYAMSVQEHAEFKQGLRVLKVSNPKPPTRTNQSFTIELARRLNALYMEYPSWAINFLTHPLIVRYELSDTLRSFSKESYIPSLGFVLSELEFSYRNGYQGTVGTMSFALLLSFICSACIEGPTWRISLLDHDRELVRVSDGLDISDMSLLISPGETTRH